MAMIMKNMIFQDLSPRDFNDFVDVLSRSKTEFGESIVNEQQENEKFIYSDKYKEHAYMKTMEYNTEKRAIIYAVHKPTDGRE